MSWHVGYDGEVEWPGVYTPDGSDLVTEVVSWAADITGDVIDGTAMNNTNGWRRKKMGLRGGAFTLECNIDQDLVPELPMAPGSDPVSVYLRSGASGGTSVTYSGTAYLTGVHPNVPVDGKVSVTIDGEFDGTISTT